MTACAALLGILFAADATCHQSQVGTIGIQTLRWIPETRCMQEWTCPGDTVVTTTLRQSMESLPWSKKILKYWNPPILRVIGRLWRLKVVESFFIENICSTCQIFNRAIFNGKHQPSSPVTPVADIANIIGTLQCEDLHANVMFDGALKGTLFLSA